MGTSGVSRQYRQITGLDDQPEEKKSKGKAKAKPEPEPELEPAIEDLTKPELQEALREHDLPVSGTKPELVERLAEAEADSE